MKSTRLSKRSKDTKEKIDWLTKHQQAMAIVREELAHILQQVGNSLLSDDLADTVKRLIDVENMAESAISEMLAKAVENGQSGLCNIFIAALKTSKKENKTWR